MRLFFFFIKIELEAAMGDADREAEIIKSSMYSHVPVFEDTYSSGANGDTSNRTPASSPGMC